MSSSSSAAGMAVKQSGPGEVSLHGPWLRILQGIWLLFVLIDLATLVIIYPRFYQGLYHVCNQSPTTDCSFDQLSSQAFAALQRAGFSIESFVLYVMTWDILTTCIFLLVGGLIFWRKPNTWMGIFVSFFLINLGSLGPSLTHGNWMPQGSLFIEIVGWGETVLAPLCPAVCRSAFLPPEI
ncbi:MAG: hypothetical protein IMW89_09175 [Ktedonobacteraceae bacterium]|nr:hypothetical protein [Ktedonobacteraceae bacterium]